MRHYVYRCYDADGDLLYIGCTQRLEVRMRVHEKQSQWYPDMVRMTVEEYSSVTAGFDAEAEAIGRENPYWNNMHRWRHRDTWTELDFQRWGHMLLRHPHPDISYQNQQQLKDLHIAYMVRFGEPFPENPMRGFARIDAEAVA
jgi:predicted GIY-YIG superfamily endonuclease